jgi:hypothetical protein
VVVRCTKAVALRHEMGDKWLLPGKEKFRYTGPNWLLLLLNRVNEETGAPILLLFWRSWHLQNNIVHGDGSCTITGSANFLLHYSESLKLAEHTAQGAEREKVKRLMEDVSRIQDPQLGINRNRGECMQKWEPPSWGWVKLNTDATFCHETGAAGTGIIIRDAEGSVLLVAWRALRGCGSPEQVEAEACLEGLRLTMEWIRQLTWAETDCQNLVNDIQRLSNARSSLAGILAEI